MNYHDILRGFIQPKPQINHSLLHAVRTCRIFHASQISTSKASGLSLCVFMNESGSTSGLVRRTEQVPRRKGYIPQPLFLLKGCDVCIKSPDASKQDRLPLSTLKFRRLRVELGHRLIFWLHQRRANCSKQAKLSQNSPYRSYRNYSAQKKGFGGWTQGRRPRRPVPSGSDVHELCLRPSARSKGIQLIGSFSVRPRLAGPPNVSSSLAEQEVCGGPHSKHQQAISLM